MTTEWTFRGWDGSADKVGPLRAELPNGTAVRFYIRQSGMLRRRWRVTMRQGLMDLWQSESHRLEGEAWREAHDMVEAGFAKFIAEERKRIEITVGPNVVPDPEAVAAFQRRLSRSLPKLIDPYEDGWRISRDRLADLLERSGIPDGWSSNDKERTFTIDLHAGQVGRFAALLAKCEELRNDG